MPRGYKLVGVAYLSINGRKAAHLQYSNGVNTISIFQHKGGGNVPISPVQSKVTNILRWAHDGMAFAAIGNIPASELRRVADSIK